MNARGPQNAGGPRSPHRKRLPKRANPLCRTSDRIEAWVSGVLFAVLALGLPAASLSVGRAAYSSELRTVNAQAAERHQVDARLSADATGSGQGRGGFQNAPVHWTEKDGTQHSGTAHVTPGTANGATVRIWVNRDGAVTDAPMPPGSAIATGWLAGGLTAGAVTAGVFGARRGVRYTLDRRRYAQWEAEWQMLEPQWSKRLRG
jgi:hypothetical protein